MVDPAPALDYAHVTQRLGASVGDEDGSDADLYPDFVPVTEGMITFTPTVALVKAATDSGPVTIVNAPIVVTIDPGGYLWRNAVRGVWLPDLGSTKVTPSIPRDQAAYVVTYSGLKYNDQPFKMAPIHINPVAGVELDLTNATPLPLPSGVTMDQIQAIATDALAAEVAAQAAQAAAEAARDATNAFNLVIGTTTTLAAGSNSTATITGTAPTKTLNLSLVRGAPGDVPGTRKVIAGTGLSGGGDLTADRTLAVTYGSAAGTAVQGNDSRLGKADGELRGTGMPEGVVTASPGAYYTDTAGTNGAWRWLKKSGTGNTGWAVVAGDTASRSVVGDSGWVAAIIDAAGVITMGAVYSVRRVNSTVSITATCAKTTTAAATAKAGIPTGWRPATTQSILLVNSAVQLVRYYHGGGSNSAIFQGPAAGGLIILFSFLTNDAWPASLPGVAG